MYKQGDKVTVSFDLAEKCPFLKSAPVTCNGVVRDDQHSKTVRVYVTAKYGKVEYYGPVEVPQSKVTRRDRRKEAEESES